MPYKYCFDPIAAAEYEAAYSWYNDQSIVASEKFMEAIEQTINDICKIHIVTSNCGKLL